MLVLVMPVAGSLHGQKTHAMTLPMTSNLVDESTTSTLPTENESNLLPTDSAVGEAPTDSSIEALSIGRLYIPRLSSRVWGLPILAGTSEIELARGVGHFSESALPQSEGNFALFGHRTTHLKPFYSINSLKVGDEIFVETGERWYVYTLRTSKIVRPTDVWVATNTRYWALKIPRREPYRVITLITCEPLFSVDKRWVWWGELSGIHPIGSPPPTLQKSPSRPTFVPKILSVAPRR